MKLIIENYIKDTNLIIQKLNNIFAKHLLYKDLGVKDNVVTTNFNFANGIFKIFSKIDDNKKKTKPKIFKFFKNDNSLLYSDSGDICYIEVRNNVIKKFNANIFTSLRSDLVVSHNKYIILQWNVYWYYLHWLTFNYLEIPLPQDKKQIMDLVTVMRKNGIKCGKCKTHFDKWLKEHDIKPSLISKDKLFDYFFVLHNDVNKRNGKQILSKEEAINIYRDKDWDSEFKKYGVDIIDLFKKNKLKEFPNLFYTTVEDNIKNLVGLNDIKKKIDKYENNTENILKVSEFKIEDNQIQVVKGWNLIGALQNGKLKNINIEDDLLFEFNYGYKKVSKLIKGKGYWIKCFNDGFLEYEDKII